MAKSKKIKVFCSIHEKQENIIKDSLLLCEEGEIITEVFPPQKEMWLFCCLCSTLIPPSIAANSKNSLCPYCENNTTEWYLCKNCLTISIDNSKPKKEQQYFIEENTLYPECPCCGKEIDTPDPVRHTCKKLDVDFFTAREECPFCKNDLAEAPVDKINRRLNRYERQINQQNEVMENSQNLSAEMQKKLELLEKTHEITEQKLLGKLEAQQANLIKLENLLKESNQTYQDLKSLYDKDFTRLNKEIGLINGAFAELKQNTIQTGEFDKHKEEVNKYIEHQDTTLEDNNREITERFANLEKRLAQIEKQSSGIVEKNIQETSNLANSRQTASALGKNAAEFDDDYDTLPHANITPLLNEIAESDSATIKTKGLISDILEQFSISKLERLSHYLLLEGVLKPVTSESETVVFYRLSIDKKDYAIPSSKTVQNANQFKQYSGIYNASTTRLNGKIKIKELAKISWDDEIKGYRCTQKGMIDIS